MAHRTGYINEFRLGCLIALLLLIGVSVASAETLMMPDRPMLMGTSEVVWGVTTQANSTAYQMDFGDGSAVVNGTVADRSYIAFNHTYTFVPVGGAFTATLTVGTGAGAESATCKITVYDPAATTAENLRNVNIKRAIENGLRFLWTSQVNRAAWFPATETTYWPSYLSFTAINVLAFENQGYQVPNDNSAPVGLYQKYIVQRGLNFLATRMATYSLNAQTNGDPCLVLGTSAPCTGLYSVDDQQGYSNAIKVLPFAGSGALDRQMGPFGPATYVNGQTYKSIVQRLAATVVWGQIDTNQACGEGGWHYSMFNNSYDSSDASTLGWNILALLDAAAGGATIPAFVKTELNTYALPNHLNANGSFAYNTNCDRNYQNNSVTYPNLAKEGIALQAAFYTGRPISDPLVQAQLSFLNQYWANPKTRNDASFTSGPYNYVCGGSGTNNLGCGYDMFNIFKGLKLYGVATMSNSTRGAGPGSIPASDWYAEYEDWLVSSQNAPTNTGGGNWPTNVLGWSGATGGDTSASTAIAELILASSALIQPDPTLFSTVGLAPATATNTKGTSHTVTATAQSTSGAPIPGVTISFLVLTGPNAGKSGSGTTDAAGQTSFTYADSSTGPYPVNDTIQAYIGQVGSNIASNIVTKTWTNVLACDVNGDGLVNLPDINIIMQGRGQKAQPGDLRDYDRDGLITVNDARACVLKCTKAGCK